MRFSTDLVQIFIWELQSSFNDLFNIVDKITLDQAQWSPSPNSRTLNTLQNWNKHGDKWLETQNLDPVSTIEYLVLHLAHCKLMYDDYAFKVENLRWDELESPAWPRTIQYLKEAHARLMESTTKIHKLQLENMVKTNWGDKWSIKKVLFALIHHDAYHLGQINSIRNLYAINRGI